MKTILFVSLALMVTVAARAEHFTTDSQIICGSEEAIRRHHYEWDHNLPYTVFKKDVNASIMPGSAGGASCSLSMISLVHPDITVTMIARHGAFCQITMYHPELMKIANVPVWVHCHDVTK